MKRTVGRRIVVAAIALAASYAAAPSNAWACGCYVDKSLSFEAVVAREFDSVELVFTGRVVGRDEETARFEVDTIWKGEAAAEVSVKHGERVGRGAFMISTCDYGFRADVRYVVFAHREGPALKASNCGHTRPFEEAQRTIAVLDMLAERRTVRRAPTR